MRILVTSDSHGKKGIFFEITEKHINDTDLFINLGDCRNGDDLEEAQLYFKDKLKLMKVAGNGDWYSSEPLINIISFNGKKVMFCHGHTLYVKMGYEKLIEEAKRQKADIALFGHTHIPYHDYIDGIHFFNPGAVQDGCYGIIDVVDNGIVCINAKL